MHGAQQHAQPYVTEYLTFLQSVVHQAVTRRHFSAVRSHVAAFMEVPVPYVPALRAPGTHPVESTPASFYRTQDTDRVRPSDYHSDVKALVSWLLGGCRDYEIVEVNFQVVIDHETHAVAKEGFWRHVVHLITVHVEPDPSALLSQHQHVVEFALSHVFVNECRVDIVKELSASFSRDCNGALVRNGEVEEVLLVQLPPDQTKEEVGNTHPFRDAAPDLEVRSLRLSGSECSPYTRKRWKTTSHSDLRPK